MWLIAFYVEYASRIESAYQLSLLFLIFIPITIGWIVIVCADSHGPHRMYPNDSGDVFLVHHHDNYQLLDGLPNVNVDLLACCAQSNRKFEHL